MSLAQESPSIELGGAIGLNLAEIYTLSGNNTSANILYNVNFFGEYYFSKHWGVKMKLMYDKKGWDDGFIEFNQDGIRHDTKFNLSYLTVPIMANWHFGIQKKWYLNFGPYTGFLLSAKETKFNTDVKSGINSFDLGIALGAGFKTELSKELWFYGELDIQNGFLDVFNETPDGYLESAKNRRFAFNVGILYAL